MAGTPSSVGSTEASTVGLLRLQGVSLGQASAATLLIRLMTLWFATALGVLCLLGPWPQRGGTPRDGGQEEARGSDP